MRIFSISSYRHGAAPQLKRLNATRAGHVSATRFKSNRAAMTTRDSALKHARYRARRVPGMPGSAHRLCVLTVVVKCSEPRWRGEGAGAERAPRVVRYSACATPAARSKRRGAFGGAQVWRERWFAHHLLFGPCFLRCLRLRRGRVARLRGCAAGVWCVVRGQGGAESGGRRATREYSSTYLAMEFANVRAGTQKRRGSQGVRPEWLQVQRATGSKAQAAWTLQHITARPAAKMYQDHHIIICCCLDRVE